MPRRVAMAFDVRVSPALRSRLCHHTENSLQSCIARGTFTPFSLASPPKHINIPSLPLHIFAQSSQSSPTPVRSFQERVQESNCNLTNCSRQLHHNLSPRSHVNCFSFHAAFQPQSSILTTPQLFQLQSLQNPFLGHV